MSYKKCVFFGHSVGGIIAFETTRYLQEQYGVILTDMEDDNYNNEDSLLKKDVTNTICHLVLSSVEDPRALSKTNRDRFSTKWFCGAEDELTTKVYSMGMMDKAAMNRIFLKRCFHPILDVIRSDFKILEKYWLRGYQWKVDNRIGSAQGGSRGDTNTKKDQTNDDLYAAEDLSPFQVTCPIFCVSALDDEFVNQERVYDWYELSTASFKQYAFPTGKHTYFSDYSNNTHEYDPTNSNSLMEMLSQICLYNEVQLEGDEDSDESEDEDEVHKYVGSSDS